MTYNNMEDYMARQRWFDLEGGADMYNDYTTSYATCRGPNLSRLRNGLRVSSGASIRPSAKAASVLGLSNS